MVNDFRELLPLSDRTSEYQKAMGMSKLEIDKARQYRSKYWTYWFGRLFFKY